MSERNEQQTPSNGLSGQQDSTYMHRTGTRKYMTSEITPYVQEALEALAYRIQEERLKLAADVDLEDGQYLPRGWRPFCAHRWLAEYLIAHRPSATAGAAEIAANAAAEELQELQEDLSNLARPAEQQ